MSLPSLNTIPLQKIEASFLRDKNVQLYVLREDLIHPIISGNKWRKLKYNIEAAKTKGLDTILTFGGAYSNHIAATAAAGKIYGLKTIGIIRGEETLPLNPTLQMAKNNGMLFKYVSRATYRTKNTPSFIQQLHQEFGAVYIVPEGGSNVLAVKGCSEIVKNITIPYDVICCACGTGGTIAGIISSTHQQVLGFPALKGGAFLVKDINDLLHEYNPQFNHKNWKLITDYHFGGYAKINEELMGFVKTFREHNNIQLDYIYTGKMLFGLYDMIVRSNEFNNQTIVVVHTGGIQGNKGFESRLKLNTNQR